MNINGGTYDIACSIYGGYLNGTSDYGSISENEVNVSGGTFNAKMSFYGGSLPRDDRNAVSIEKNKVTIKNVTLANGSEIYGGQSSKVKIDSNIVTIDSGTFNNVVIVGGKSQTAEVLNNSVVLNGGNFTGGTKIVAGIGVNDSDKFSGNSISLVGNNALDLSGASLMGYDGTDAGIANSTLKVGRANVKVQDIKNFGTIAFDLNGVSSDSVVLKMQGASPYALSNLGTVSISVSGIELVGDDFITLLNNVSGDTTNITVSTSGGHVMVLGNDLVYYTGTTPTALKADYTITGTTVINSLHSDGHTYSIEIVGNTDTLASELSNIDMVVRRGTYENTIYGVKYDDDSATEISGNKVTIHDGSFKAVYGAYAKNGQVTGNTLTFEGGISGEGMSIYAGYVVQNGYVEGNKIFIKGGETGDNKTIAAGYIGGTGDAKGNEITITGGKVGGNNFIKIYGAKVTDGSAKNNAVNINGAWVGKWADIYGGYAKTDSADYNVVKIENTTVGADCTVYGGNSYENNGYSPSGKDAKNNRVEILDGVTMTDESSVFKEVVGGCGTYEVSNNSVLIKSGSYQAVAGGIGRYALAITYDFGVSYNSVKITGGTLVGGTSTGFGADGHVYGGLSGTNGTGVSNNSVELDGVTIKDSVKIYGGCATSSSPTSAFANSVTVANLQCEAGYSEIYGGYSSVDSSSENTVTIKSGAWEKVCGGYGGAGAESNTVIIEGGSFSTSGKIYGGYSESGTVGGDSEDKGNKVIINTTGTVEGTIYGGYSNTSGDVKYNRVNIKDGNFTKAIFGGWSISGIAGYNKVIIESGTFSKTIVGGRGAANAENNEVTISGGTFNDSGQYIQGGYGGSDAKGNTVTIIGGTFTDNYKLYGGYTTGTSSNNTLNLKIKMGGKASEVKYFQNMNFTLPSNITNGNIMLSTDKLEVDGSGGTATINVCTDSGIELNEGDVITLVDASTGSIEDKYTVGKIFDVLATEVTAGAVYRTDMAKVTIDTTSIKPSIKLTMLDSYSNAWYGTTAGGFTRKKSEAVAVGGELIIDGAAPSFAKTKYFYGGYSNANDIEVKDNIVNVNNGTFGPKMEIFGGYSENGPANNNTVNINGGIFNDGYKLYGGLGTSSSNNTLNLNIKMDGKAKSVSHFQTMNFVLPAGTANGQTMLSTETLKFDDTKTIINVDASGTILNNGDVITLIASDSVPTGVWQAGNITGTEGAISLSNNKLLFTIGGSSGGDEDQQKAPVEGIAAAVQTVNMSADLASGEGMKSLIAETAGGVTNTFGALTTGQSKYKTGSHVDVDGWGILVGAGKTKEWGNGEATSLGVFFEYGKGDFDTYNGNVHGDGNSKNQGIGFMMRHKMMNNTYYEGNIRYGKKSTEWGESEIGSYDTDSRYYGISVGMGHIYQAGKNEIDVYGRYTYGHVGACDAMVGTSEYHFDSVKSHRVRVGGKYNFKQKNSNAKPYVGIAWEHEFKGETRATISGVGEAPAPSMKGNTGILEVGCDWNVSKKWTVGLGANAYVGKRKGWDGMARIFYNF